MTGGQTALSLGSASNSPTFNGAGEVKRVDGNRAPLKVVRASAEESAAHEARLAAIDKASGGNCVWKKLEGAEKA